MDYENKPCYKCGKVFDLSSNVVVCPECGTPYHRECYAELGKCINDELHAEGGNWNDMHRSITPDFFINNETICLFCGQVNSADVYVCEKCGKDLVYAQDRPIITDDKITLCFYDRFFGMDPGEKLDGVTIAELTDFIGRGAQYYLSAFRKIHSTGRPTLNIFALLFPNMYFAFRRMPLLWMLSLLFTVVLAVPWTIMSLPNEWLTDYNGIFAMLGMNVDFTALVIPQAIGIATLILRYAFQVFMCLFANHFYYRRAIKKTKQVKAYGGGKYEIRACGGTMVVNIILNFFISSDAVIFGFFLCELVF
ncbi:MAG: hypothetical protein LBR54_00775 [Oscillospiraceae bacterium]|jgi:DNA-directed RNA polymerase subunit RPC12/RpoP|nr:hypothetical protein [Oscillospiraceae bacterium]